MRDFHHHQDRAYGRTAQLIMLLIIATAGTTLVTGAALTYLLVVVLIGAGLDPAHFQLQLIEVFLVVSLGAAILIAVSSLNKMNQLRAGGKVIAEDLGGVRVESRTSNRNQRRVLNVVQELAVASGIPAPAVYVLPNQRGINAFAAGLTLEDTVIGVTQGCLERLNRDQLQGVIGHEFSHVLNGDMRLNLRLVGLLHGLLGVSLFAEALLQSAHELTSTPSHHRDAAGEMGLAVLMLLAGLLLWPVGLIGTLFGMLVMSATSRQREFLADAYAVQFTRNPEGLAGALKVLAGCEAGSRVRAAKALEASHFFFAPGCRWAAGWMATHPPLAERILRLDPRWDGIPLFEADEFDEAAEDHVGSLSLMQGTATAGLVPRPDERAEVAPTPEARVTTNSGAGDESLLVAADAAADERHRVLSSLPPGWQDVVADREACQAVLVAIWLSAGEMQVQDVERSDGPAHEVVQRLGDELARLDDAQRMVLFDLAVGSLDQLAASQTGPFRRQLEMLLDDHADDDFVRWAIAWQLRRRLGMETSPAARPCYGTLNDVQPACELLLSLVCHLGSDHEAMAQYAFQRAVAHLELRDPEFWTRAEISCEPLDAAVGLIAELAPRPRRQLLTSLGRCLAADQGITASEACFVGGLYAALDLPAPTLLPGQVVTPGS